MRNMTSNEAGNKSLQFYFTMMLFHPGFPPSLSFTNVTNLQEELAIKQVPNRFSVGIGSLEEDNLIMLTGLKETLKPHRERILETLKEIEE